MSVISETSKVVRVLLYAIIFIPFLSIDRTQVQGKALLPPGCYILYYWKDICS